MSEVATRVAVLGVEGDARAQLRRALAEFGADIAIEGDPRQLDPAAVSSASPAFILVSLDDAIEDALDSWQDLFDNPEITVIFDEAAVTRELGGWELARWARHLASKLLGDQTAILPAPPAHAERLPQSDLQPRPGAPITPEQTMRDARLEDYTRDTVDLAGAVPVNERPGLAPAAGSAANLAASPATSVDPFDAMALELNDAAIERALMGPPAQEVERSDGAESARELSDFMLDLDPGIDAVIQADIATAATSAPTDSGLDWAALEAGFDLSGFGEPTPPMQVPASEPVAVEAVHPEAVAEHDEVVDLAAELHALQDSTPSDAELPPESGDGAAFDEYEFIELIEMGDAQNASLNASTDAIAARDASDDGDELSADDDTLQLLELAVGGDAETVNFAQFAHDDESALELDPALMAMAAELEAQHAHAHHAVAEPDFAQRADNPAERPAAPPTTFAATTEPAPATQAPRPSMFGTLELALEDADASPVARQSAGPGLDVMDFDALVAGLSLVESDAPAVSTRRGVIAVFAGTGGPDAVRQVLSHLPVELSVPVMVAQRLDAGNHDRLVPQLAKVCPLPVVLAEADHAASGGAVAVLPTGMGVEVGRHGDIRFAARGQNSSEVLRQLATFGADLVVVIASGADHDISEALSHCLSEGAVVIGQEPSSCFDCAAADQVKMLGGQIGAVGELTAQAVKRWKS